MSNLKKQHANDKERLRKVRGLETEWNILSDMIAAGYRPAESSIAKAILMCAELQKVEGTRPTPLVVPVEVLREIAEALVPTRRGRRKVQTTVEQYLKEKEISWSAYFDQMDRTEKKEPAPYSNATAEAAKRAGKGVKTIEKLRQRIPYPNEDDVF